MIIKMPKTKVKVEHHTCPYHKEHPLDRNYPGCTCSSGYSSVIDDKTQEEVNFEKIQNEIMEEYDDMFKKMSGT